MTQPGGFEIHSPPGDFAAAEAVGLDPGCDRSNAEIAERLRGALAEHGVLCIRAQEKLADHGFRSLAEMFGPVKNPLGRTRDGGLFQYAEERQVIDAGFVITDALREKLGELSFGGLDGERPGLFETFHIDDSYTEEPASATVLHARALPPSGGGNTVFLDLRAAYELLPPGERQRLRALRAVHEYDNRGAFSSRVSARGPADQLVPVSYPIVRTHPITGRLALCLDLDRATHVEGMPEDEGRALLASLQEHAEKHAPRHEHVWQPFDVLVWDNASVQHKARGDYPVGEPRCFWRHMIEGERPR